MYIMSLIGGFMLELYVMETCPFCRKVMKFMEENCVEYIKNDISNPLFAPK